MVVAILIVLYDSVILCGLLEYQMFLLLLTGHNMELYYEWQQSTPLDAQITH